MSATATDTAAAEFVAHFAAGWAIGATDPEAFYAHFADRCHPDVLMVAPLLPPQRGPRAIPAQLGPVFAAVPDLKAEVRGWGETPDGVLIEIRLRGHIDGKPIEWDAVDKIVLEDGLVRERTSYFDSVPLMRALALHPPTALTLLKARLKRKDPR